MGVSDTTWIAGLLVIALFVSAVGTLSLVGRISATGLGSDTGTTEANVQASTTISLTVESVNFGNVNLNASDDTTDNSPAPFVVRNDGSVNVNITINATPLWSGVSKVASDYQVMCGDNSGNPRGVDCPTGSVESWTDLTTSPQKIIANLPFADNGDEVQAEIKIHVPLDEPAGAKSSTVYFIADQA
ncbi:MAG: hypothetical protein QXL81_03090 [Candidatus Aenigmatarchaeota archaeon]